MDENLTFFVQQKKQYSRADRKDSFKEPSVYPSFVLVFNYDWNDYSYYTWFALWYCENPETKHFIGELRLMKRGEPNTFEVIPKEFSTPLSDDYCSLGITSGYYDKMASLFSREKAYEILSYLRDCAADVQIREIFDHEDAYKNSLMRDYSSQRALKDCKFILEDRGAEKAYSFKYNFYVPYAIDRRNGVAVSAEWDVNINYFAESFDRIIGIIGENGVGKTSMLRGFVENMIAKQPDNLEHKPLFNTLSVISSVASDRYPPLEDSTALPYFCHSLEHNDDSIKIIMDSGRRIQRSLYLVNNKSKMQIYRNMICSIVGRDSKDWFGEEEIHYEWGDEKKIVINEEVFEKRLQILSSGQLHIVALTTYLIADMHVGSLVIIDEPEVHLHPSAIVYFMKYLYDILQQFEGYAFIATHSPLIIREILKDNVYHFIRTRENIPMISKVAYDTFGEDISTLYNKIFDYDENQSIFSMIVERLARKNVKREQIEKLLAPNGSMNLNAKLRIFDIINSMSHSEENEGV